MIPRFLREVWEYLTYDYYGRRRLRPSTYALMLGFALAGGMLLAGAILARTAPGEPRPAPTLPPPTWTAILATGTAMAARPTPTPAPACPPNPLLWRLVPVKPFLDPKTGKPVELPKPLYRIDPPCVYEGFWRDVAGDLFLARSDRPSVDKWLQNVPWYWEPGTEITRKPFYPTAPSKAAAVFYDRQWKRIDGVLTPYTALATGDPDFPVVIYLYWDYPGSAYWVYWRDGKAESAARTLLQGGTVLRLVTAWFYDVRTGRWYRGDLRRSASYPRWVHAVGADGSGLWELLGVKGFRRSELAQTFGYQEFSPNEMDPKAIEVRRDLSIGP